MKFLIKGTEPETVVTTDLVHHGKELALLFGGYKFIRVLEDGRIFFCKFFKGSPMHDYCVKHGFPMTEVDGHHPEFKLVLF